MSFIFGVTALHDLFRPGLPPSVSQFRRSLHLWYATNAKTSLGNHKIKDFVKAADLFKKSNLKYGPRLDLWTEKLRKLIAPNIDLQTVIQKHIRPGIFLTRLRDPKAEAENPSPIRQYMLSRINVEKVPSTKNLVKGRGSNEFHFPPGKDGNLDYFSHCMYLAWHKLSSHRLVEFHIHQKVKLPNEEAFRKLVEENFHLWPDVIGKAMPERSATVVDPQTNFIKMCWVIGPPRKMENGDLKPPINVTKNLYVQQNHQFQLDKMGLGQITKLEKRMKKKSMLTDVKTGVAMGKESGNLSLNLEGKKEFTLAYVKTG
jgi:hypothetical protein